MQQQNQGLLAKSKIKNFIVRVFNAKQCYFCRRGMESVPLYELAAQWFYLLPLFFMQLAISGVVLSMVWRPVLSFYHRYHHTLEKMTECSICICEIDAGSEHTMHNCLHTFHRKCIYEWTYQQIDISTQASCPLCRTPVWMETTMPDKNARQRLSVLLSVSPKARELAELLIDCPGVAWFVESLEENMKQAGMSSRPKFYDDWKSLMTPEMLATIMNAMKHLSGDHLSLILDVQKEQNRS